MSRLSEADSQEQPERKIQIEGGQREASTALRKANEKRVENRGPKGFSRKPGLRCSPLGGSGVQEK